MAKLLSSAYSSLIDYLGSTGEKANEDKALQFFREIFGKSFSRQKDAAGADGYLPEHFVLELKHRPNDWLSGLFQGIAYKRNGLVFSSVVVGTQGFLAAWDLASLPADVLQWIANCPGAPNQVGKKAAKQFLSLKKDFLKRAAWKNDSPLDPLFNGDTKQVQHVLENLIQFLRSNKKEKIAITTKNFRTVLKQMLPFFARERPTDACRAFYRVLRHWDINCTAVLSPNNPKALLFGAAEIEFVLPHMRNEFRTFLETHYVHLGEGESFDFFFAEYDKAITAVAPSFRTQHGIFFTDLNLAKFAMWVAKQHLPELGKNYLVLDPACGSGNLVTNWKSPLLLRHKVVSEIQPELLAAVEERMRLDSWHEGRYTVVPKLSENKGLNFLSHSAKDYLKIISEHLVKKGRAADKPIAILCNPPYRNDDDQATGGISYEVNDEITNIVGKDASSERFCCFLAQMKLLCEAAAESGLPEESLLLLFTPTTWLTRRKTFSELRKAMLSTFEDITAFMVNAKEFFDIKGTWPIMFSIWKYRSSGQLPSSDRSIAITDLTWVKKKQLASLRWGTDNLDVDCLNLLADERTKVVNYGQERQSIRLWSNARMTDFKRDRRKAEKNAKIAGGLPLGDERHKNIKTYGASTGIYLGFMDDMTPCRVSRSVNNVPWFYLDDRFMGHRRTRCFSGPPDNRGFSAHDLPSAKKIFFWYALCRSFSVKKFPTWVGGENVWNPTIPSAQQAEIFTIVSALVFADNDCVEAHFPKNNPVADAPEVSVVNPLSPLNKMSFWETTVRPTLSFRQNLEAERLVEAVDNLFRVWASMFRKDDFLYLPESRPYFLTEYALGVGAGIYQIRDYAKSHNDKILMTHLKTVDEALKKMYLKFVHLVWDVDGLNYFAEYAAEPRELSLHTDFVGPYVHARKAAAFQRNELQRAVGKKRAAKKPSQGPKRTKLR